MIFQKYNGKTFGVNLNKEEQRVLDEEIRRQCSEAVDDMEKQVDILMLWQLHSQEGWGKKRLERFYRDFAVYFQKLKEYYSADDPGDTFWIMERQLKEIDVDVDALMKEFDEKYGDQL